MNLSRCDYCKKPIPAGAKAISSRDGLLFDSIQCKERYHRKATIHALANAVRVGRSQLKARTIARTEAVYRELGGRGWSKVEKLLRAVL